MLKIKHLLPLLMLPFIAAQTLAAKTTSSQVLAIEQLMPVPRAVQLVDGGPFRLSPDFHIGITGNPDARLYSAAQRFQQRLDRRTGQFFTRTYPSPTKSDADVSLLISVNAPGIISLDMQEDYRLEVTADQIHLSASTDIGAMHGLETLLQLLDADTLSYLWQACIIEDAPRFPWRGLMIDSSRHFMPLDMIKRNLDGMASVKLNVLHWHLTDDQGFRIESKNFPKLHESGSDGFYYTYEDVREIVDYAAARGIRVVPEFDVPGHASSWLAAYPELASAPGPYEIERGWGIFDPCLNPANPEVYAFLEVLFHEMAALFPDKYFHIGGDEVNGKHWDANTDIQAFMREHDLADNHELQRYFNEQVFEMLEAEGKTMIGWDEILQAGMPKDVMIQSWRGHESMKSAARGGYASILSNGYYIDLMYPAKDHYLNDPLPADSGLSQEEQNRILGGEATMWSEYVTDETVDSRIWPRTAAIAERLWSRASVNDVDNMYARMEHISLLLEDLGLQHRKNREAMMRRLVGGDNTAPISILVDVIEPLKEYQRYEYRTQNQLSPYSLLVDIARADAPDARSFNLWTDAYLENRDETALLHMLKLLDQWKQNECAYLKVSEQSPVLREGDNIVTSLKALAEVACASIAVLEGQQKHLPTGLEEKAPQIFETSRRPMAACTIQIVDAVEQLFEKAKAEQAQR